MKTKKVIVAAMMAGMVCMSAEASYLGSGYGATEVDVWGTDAKPWINQHNEIVVRFETRCSCVCEPIC